MKIYVSKADIEKAKKILKIIPGVSIDEDANFSLSCPISQAIRRKTKKKVETGTYYCYIGCNKYGQKSYKLNEKARKFIKKFDKTGIVNPTWITLIEEKLDE